MMKNRRHLIAATLALGSLLWGGSRAALGRQEWDRPGRGYTLASFRGDYAAVATYGANVARALGTQTVDGFGKLRGSAVVNQPAPDGTRTIVNISFTGTYTVNSDGTGTMSLKITLPSGNTANATEDFVITKAAMRDGLLTATDVVDAQEQPSTVIPGGVFVTHTYTLRPE